ncbi:hypothetical protein B0H50_11119 [Hallerella porci]|uniref:Maturase K n=1 Tax=Hallerella porci TaxID=1945871 RepID=A0ABX5LRA2_9BACT|nr:hypothetical protein B0H50_11119 [Hallerella porci]
MKFLRRLDLFYYLIYFPSMLKLFVTTIIIREILAFQNQLV